jgi:hypothetical protein
VPNLSALLALNKVLVQETQTYLWSGDLERHHDE